MWWNLLKLVPEILFSSQDFCKIVGEHVFCDPSPATNGHRTALKTKAFTPPVNQKDYLVMEKKPAFADAFPQFDGNCHFFFSDFAVFKIASLKILTSDGPPFVWTLPLVAPGKDVFMSCGGGGAKAAKEAKLWEEILWMLPPEKNGKNPARWWFQIFLMFTTIWGRFPFWLIFSSGLKPPTSLERIAGRRSHGVHI